MKIKPISSYLGTTVGLALLMVNLLSIKGFSQSLDSNFFIFLAFGQSNMEGYASGSVTQIEKQDTTNVPSRFQVLYAADADTKRTKGTWATAVPPLCRSGTGLCPCDYFGRTLVDSLPSTIKIGIINVAVAGTAIELFDKDKYTTYLNSLNNYINTYSTNYYGGSPYGRLVEMGKAAQKVGVIKGFLLHQGESGTGISGDNWVTEVTKIYTDLIKDLSLDSNKVPFLAGGLTSDGKNNTNTSLPWNLYSPSKAFKNCYVVSSIGCAANTNDGYSGLHFNAAGYRELGKHYADSMLVAFKKLGTGATAIAKPNEKSGYAMGNGVELKTGSASVSFEIPYRAFVTIKAYTMNGKEIARLTSAEFAAGKHVLEIGRNVIPAGVFIIKMNAGSMSATRTVMACAH